MSVAPITVDLLPAPIVVRDTGPRRTGTRWLRVVDVMPMPWSSSGPMRVQVFEARTDGRWHFAGDRADTIRPIGTVGRDTVSYVGPPGPVEWPGERHPDTDRMRKYLDIFLPVPKRSRRDRFHREATGGI